MLIEDIILSKHNLEKEKVLSYLSLNKDDIVLFCGSVVEGFSNKGSDLDVYIISTGEYMLPINREVNNTYLGEEFHVFEEDIPINVTLMNLNNVNLIIDYINNQLFLGKIDFTESRKIELYQRLITAVPVKNSEYYNVYIQKKLYRKKFEIALCRNRLSYSENRHDDAIGAIESDDFLTAYIGARISLEKAVESLLYLQGENNPKDKWIIKKLFNVYTEDDSWVQEFISLYFGQLDDLHEDIVKEKAISMIRLASRIRGMVVDRV